MRRSVHLRSWLLASGYSVREVERMRRTGELSPVRRGAYSSNGLPDAGDERHILRVRAATEQLISDAVVSYVSAAVMHGLPVWNMPLDRVHVTRNRRRTGGRRDPSVHVHAAPLDRDEVVVIDGVPVTAVQRTLTDIARSAPFDRTVVLADAALAGELVSPASLQVALQRQAGWPGVAGARRALGFADGRSESVGESRSRIAIAEAGLPAPTLQWEVTAGCRVIARVDFGWPDRATVGEFDGKAEYGRLLRPGQEPGDTVFAEKRREDAIRAAGLTVVRWTWDDLNDFTNVATRLRTHLR